MSKRFVIAPVLLIALVSGGFLTAATPPLLSQLIGPDVLPGGLKVKTWRFKTVERGDAQYLITSGRVEGAEVQYDNVRAYWSKSLLAFESIQIRLVRYKTPRHAHTAFVAARRSYPLSPWGSLGEESARRIEAAADGRLVTTVWRSGPVLAVAYFTGSDGALRERILRAQQRNLR